MVWLSKKPKYQVCVLSLQGRVLHQELISRLWWNLLTLAVLTICSQLGIDIPQEKMFKITTVEIGAKE